MTECVVHVEGESLLLVDDRGFPLSNVVQLTVVKGKAGEPFKVRATFEGIRVGEARIPVDHRQTRMDDYLGKTQGPAPAPMWTPPAAAPNAVDPAQADTASEAPTSPAEPAHSTLAEKVLNGAAEALAGPGWIPAGCQEVSDWSIVPAEDESGESVVKAVVTIGGTETQLTKVVGHLPPGAVVKPYVRLHDLFGDQFDPKLEVMVLSAGGVPEPAGAA